MPRDIDKYMRELDLTGTLGTPILIFIPHVFPLAAPFLLGYLKKRGYSGCKVEVSEGGLALKVFR
jgi:hypothetical protein